MNGSQAFRYGDPFQGGNALRWFPPWRPPSRFRLRREVSLGGVSHSPQHPSSPEERGWGTWYRLGVLGACLGLAACAPARFPVTLEVDYGPAGKPPVRETVEVARGAVPHDALRAVVPFERGAVCCDPRETAAIDGVAVDPAANRWWSVSVNGSRRVSPYKTRLKPGDEVRWTYRSYDQ